MYRGLVTLLCALAAASAAGFARRPLPFYYDLYTFRGPPGRTAVVAAFAVPTDRLERESGDSEVRYRFDVTLVLADTASRSVYRTDDSVFFAVPRALGGDHLLHTFVQIQAPPSATTVQRVIMNDETTPGIGQLYTSSFSVPDYSGDHLMLSDIALGVPDNETGWERGDVRLALLPASQFPGSDFDLFYEVYNLPHGHEYTTEISIEPTGDDAEENEDVRTVRTRFSGEAESLADGTLGELRRVDASLEKGSYLLTVVVTDENTGETARRSRAIEVHGGGQTTLVHAIPRRKATSLR